MLLLDIGIPVPNGIEYFPVITVDSINPPSNCWSLPPLARRLKSNVVRFWFAVYTEEQVYTIRQDLGGQSKTDSVKSVSLKSKPSYTKQGLVQLRSIWSKRVRSGTWIEVQDYRTIFDRLDSQVALGTMNLSQYDKKRIKYWPVIVQPKINGHRCLAFLRDNEVHLRTRSNSEYYYLQHIRNELLPMLRALPNNSVLDGELYIPGYARNEISSQLRVSSSTSKVEYTLPAEEDKVYYCLFDISNSKSQEQRIEILQDVYAQYAVSSLHRVASWKVNSYTEIDQLYDKVVHEGYEGLVIRLLKDKKGDLCYYEHGRSTKAMKRKSWYEEDVEVVSVAETDSGSRREEHAALLGVQYGSSVVYIRAGTYEERYNWLSNPSSIIGRIITIKFETVNADSGLPQQPTIVSFRDTYD